MKFPKVITRRGQKATIYGRTARYPKYRLCYQAEGKRITRVFWAYGEALAAATSTIAARSMADCGISGKRKRNCGRAHQ